MAKIPVKVAGRGLETGSAPQYPGSNPIAGAVANLGSTMMDVASEYQRQQEAIEDFDANQRFEQMKIRANGQMPDILAKAPASGQGIHQSAMEVFEKQSTEFLQSVPERLRPRFQTLTQTAREQWANVTAVDELTQRNTWYRSNIDTSIQESQNQVYNDPAQFDAARDQVFRAIDSSGLPQAEKEELRRKAEATISLASANREISNIEANPDALLTAGERLGLPHAATTTGGGDAMSVIREFEGFREDPYWDVNAHRIGYGSDTITTASGQIVRVEKGMRVTKADAERDLARRAKEFERTAVSQIGPAAWNALPGNAQAALVSVTYNYGELPENVVMAARTGDIGSIASAVESRSGDNGGINKGRRQKEAALIRGQSTISSNSPPLDESTMDPRYAGLPLDLRLDVYAKMKAAAQRGQTAIDAQTKAFQTQTNDNYRLRIATADPTLSERDILRDPVLDEGQKATLINSFKEASESVLQAGQDVAALATGGLSLDPYAAKDKTRADNLYTTATKGLDADQSAAIASAIIQQTGVVPQPVLNNIRKGLASQSVPEVAAAAQSAQRISSFDPAVLARRDGGSDVQKTADDFTYYVNKLNMTPEQAAQRIIDNRNPEKQMARKALEPAAKEFVKSVEAEDLAAVFDESWMPGDPELGVNPAQEAGIKAEFVAIAEDQFYQANGDPEIAKNRAIEQMKRLYGVTEIGGSTTVMKHPPEKYWPKLPEAGFLGFEGDPFGYAKKQLQEDIGAFGSEVDTGSIALVTTPETDAMVKRGELPAYAVLYKDANGVYQTIPGKLWRPDVNPETVRAKADEARLEQEQAVERARGQQEIDRERAETQALPDAGREQSLDAFLDGPPQIPADLSVPAPAGEPSLQDRLDERRDELFQNVPTNGGGGW